MHASDEPRRPRAIGGATRLVGVIGWPVEHSLSPAIHNAAFVALDLDWAYVPLAGPARGAACGRRRAGRARRPRRERDDAPQDARAPTSPTSSPTTLAGSRAVNTLRGARRPGARPQHRRARVRPVPASRRGLRPGRPGGPRLRRRWCGAGPWRSPWPRVGVSELTVARARPGAARVPCSAPSTGRTPGSRVIAARPSRGSRGRPRRQRDPARRRRARPRRLAAARARGRRRRPALPRRPAPRCSTPPAMPAPMRTGASGCCCTRQRSRSSCGPAPRRRST